MPVIEVAGTPLISVELAGKLKSEVMKVAERIYTELTEKGIDVILDDRADRPGVKFKDSELVGFPIRIGIGERSLAKGELEVKRRDGALENCKVEDVITHIQKMLGAEV